MYELVTKWINKVKINSASTLNKVLNKLVFLCDSPKINFNEVINLKVTIDFYNVMTPLYHNSSLFTNNIEIVKVKN